MLAQNAFYEQKIPDAIALYTRAAPMLTDGEGYLNLAKLLDYAGRKAEAKEAARQALAKGVKKPEEATASGNDAQARRVEVVLGGAQ